MLTTPSQLVRETCTVIIFCFLSVSVNYGQSGTALNRAFSHLQVQHYDSALLYLEPILKSDSVPGRAWMMAGTAALGLKDSKAAIHYYTRALETTGTAPRAWFQLGVANARSGNNDKAYQAFIEAKKRGFNTTTAGLNPDLGSFKEDARYQELYPSKKEYKDPFVEPVKILQDWYGEQPGDVFGWMARNIGDVDNDGINDLVTSAPYHQVPGQNAGKVYVYSGGSGRMLWSVTGRKGQTLGLGIEATGDVNNDGIPDVFAGAPGADSAFVFSGNDGRILIRLAGEEQGDRFGRDGKGAGDLNEDGHVDFLVGAPGYDNGRGAMYLFSGRDGKLLLRLTGETPGEGFGTTVSGDPFGEEGFLVVGAPNHGLSQQGRTYVYKWPRDQPLFTIEPETASINLGGMFISVVGDVNGDHTADIYASDWAYAAKGFQTGAAYVHSGKDGARLYRFIGENGGDGFGIGIGDAGDMDRDGFDDLVIGAWQHASAAPSGGRIYLYAGKDGSLLYTITGKVMGETLGFDATGIGDVNGDGIPDLLVTSAYSAIRGTRSGRMMIISGNLK